MMSSMGKWRRMEAAFLTSSRLSERTTSCRLQLLLVAENAGFGRICHPEQGCPWVSEMMTYRAATDSSRAKMWRSPLGHCRVIGCIAKGG